MSLTSNGLAREGRSRSELLATAADCFSRYGYAGSSIDRIARRAGVSKGAIYYHFRDKQDLLAAAVLEVAARAARVAVDIPVFDPEHEFSGALV